MRGATRAVAHEGEAHTGGQTLRRALTPVRRAHGAALPVLLPLRRGHIAAAEGLGIEELGQPEVRDAYGSRLVDEQIGALDVAVRDAAPRQVG